MHAFGIAVLLGLAVMIVAALVERYLARVPEVRALVFLGLGIIAAWVMDFGLWREWAMPTRADWLDTTLTGVILGGVAHAWHVLLGFVEGLSRKVTDEATTIERTQLRAA
jgi:drug/metabolite transporter (DMT)-like permease